MDKNIIKQHLTQRFLSEAKDEASTPGINITKAVTKKSGEVNKAGVKAIAKDVTSYEKNVKSDKDSGKMATNKFNYNGDKEKQYHDKMEIENGTEMNEYDREPNKDFKDRAKEALEGSSRMGNKGGKDMGNAEASQGSSSDDFGKTKLKNAEDSAKLRAKATDNLLSFGDVIIPNPNPSKAMRKHSAYTNEGLDADSRNIAANNPYGSEDQYDFENSEEAKEPNKTDNNDKPKIKESMKRLKFNQVFNGVGNALKMIPETYRIDNKEFEMTDGNETYRIRWEGTLSEGRAVVLTASDKKMVNEDMQKMKHLWGYKSQETLGLVKGNDRLNENAVFGNIWDKTKALLEGQDIESTKAKTGNLEDIKKKAPEATKHVQGSVSKDKGTKAPAAKEGDLDDAVSHASEAKKHVEGSVSTEKGTKAPAPKKGEWENVKKKASEATKHVKMNESFNEEEEEEEVDTDDVTTEEVEETKMVKTEGSNIEGTKASKTAPWEDHNVKHAAEAKKHIHMGEGLTLNGKIFTPINENYEDDEEDTRIDYGMGNKENQIPKPPKSLKLDIDEEEEEEIDDTEPSDTDISGDTQTDEDDLAPKASGARLMVSKSTGDYYIIGAGPSPILVPVEDKERAKMDPAKYVEEMNSDDDYDMGE